MGSLCLLQPQHLISVFSVLEHSFEMEKKAPFTTSACLLLPKWEHAAFQKLLNGCEVLQSYEAGTQVPKTSSTRIFYGLM